MNITRFRPPIKGPESRLENIVASSLHDTIHLKADHTWIAASAPLGAGRPDLTVVSYRPEIFRLATLDMVTIELLAYLYSRKRARLVTIENRLRRPRPIISSRLAALVDSEIVLKDENSFYLNASWRSILTEITAIEVKVHDWRRAVQQAARNTVLAHRSYVALPKRAATIAAADPAVSAFGLGVIEIDEDEYVSVIKPAQKRRPKVPHYYFKLASLLAAQ